MYYLIFQVSHFLHPPIQGIVLQTYGAGNGPDTRKDLLKLFKEATERGVIILNITQCTRGFVSATYAAGKVRKYRKNPVHKKVL